MGEIKTIICNICGAEVDNNDTMTLLTHFRSEKHEKALAKLQHEQVENWLEVERNK